MSKFSIGERVEKTADHEDGIVIAVRPPHVRCRRRSGQHVLGESISPFDPTETLVRRQN